MEIKIQTNTDLGPDPVSGSVYWIRSYNILVDFPPTKEQDIHPSSGLLVFTHAHALTHTHTHTQSLTQGVIDVKLSINKLPGQF